MAGTPRDGRTLYFQCLDININVPKPVILSNELASGTSVIINVSLVSPKSKNLLY